MYLFKLSGLVRCQEFKEEELFRFEVTDSLYVSLDGSQLRTVLLASSPVEQPITQITELKSRLEIQLPYALSFETLQNYWLSIHTIKSSRSVNRFSTTAKFPPTLYTYHYCSLQPYTYHHVVSSCSLIDVSITRPNIQQLMNRSVLSTRLLVSQRHPALPAKKWYLEGWINL